MSWKRKGKRGLERCVLSFLIFSRTASVDFLSFIFFYAALVSLHALIDVKLESTVEKKGHPT